MTASLPQLRVQKILELWTRIRKESPELWKLIQDFAKGKA